jgi:SAM-dependent methyltransferase
MKEKKLNPEKFDKAAATTQVATTVGSYQKAIQQLLPDLNPGDTVLDYGAGLGLGTQAMQDIVGPDIKVFSYEPFPERGKYTPDYIDPPEDQQFDAVVCLNVLNVLPKAIRDGAVAHIFAVLKPTGIAAISARAFVGDIANAKNFEEGPEEKSYTILRKKDGEIVKVFQKGFDGSELIDYLSKFTSRPLKKKSTAFGKNSILVGPETQKESLTESSAFWNQTHPKSKELDRLWDQYIPDQGDADTLEAQLLLSGNRLVYDAYNNGWGVNNMSGELELLHLHGFFKEVSLEDVSTGNYESYDDSGYFDTELERLIDLLARAEEEDSWTPYVDEGYGMSSAEWDQMIWGDEDDDYDYYEEDFSSDQDHLREDYSAMAPDKKDIKRAEGLKDGTAAAKMVKLIKDKGKLIRRAKAVISKWGLDDERSAPFLDALAEAGLTDEDIEEIAGYVAPKNSSPGFHKYDAFMQSNPDLDLNHRDLRGRSRRTRPVLPMGTINPKKGDSKYFNIYDQWKNYPTTVEVWLDIDTDKFKYVIGSGGSPLGEKGTPATFSHDQMPGRNLFAGRLVDWYSLEDFKDSIYGIASAYVYK